MNNDDICQRLGKWISLFYGKDKEQYIVSYKKGDYFYFGYENEDDFVINKVTKPVAIFLALGNTSFLKFLDKQKVNNNDKKRKRTRVLLGKNKKN